ncbi:MAG TPA: MFS transporter [Rhodocyclaceae bacterium]|nr:MFS transporter [Rhodocyclaceae bacterium]
MHGFYERHRFLILFAVLSTLMGTSVGMAKITTSLYAIDLHAPEALLGLIAGAQTAGVLIMSLPIGHLVDRLGPARLFVTGTLLAGSLYVVLPLVASPWFLLGCTTAISFFMPMRFVSLNTVFMQQLEHVGEAKAGWYRGTHMAGMFLIGPLVASSAVALMGFAGTYWTIAAMFALTICVSPIIFGSYAERGTGGGRLRLRDIVAQLGLLRSERELRMTCLLEFAGQGVNAFYSFFIIVIAINQLHLGAGSATVLINAEGLSFIATLFTMGGPLSRLGAARSYAISLSLAVAALVVLGLATSLNVLLAGGALLGLALGCLQIVNLTFFARIGARLGRGKVAGLTAMSGPAGSMAASLVGGALGAVLGLQSAFLVFAAGFVLLALALGVRSRLAVA